MSLTNLQWNILAISLLVIVSTIFLIQQGRITGYIVLSTNASGGPNVSAYVDIGTYCLLIVNTNQSATDESSYPEHLLPIAFGAIDIGEVGNPQQITVWSNSSSTANITVLINGSNWVCTSGTCLSVEEPTTNNWMSVNTTKYKNYTTDSTTTGADIDSTTEYNTGSGIYEVTTSNENIHGQVAPNEARDAWFNILVPEGTAPGFYLQNLTYAWSC
ncbi:MAG: hypothetical protein ACTSPB_04550 [Candidatus Thorarchaeota archaeon]